MCEPVAGLPRVDRCVSAMLLTAWVALKLGDRVSIHAFDSRPRLSSGLVSGSGAFTELERIAAQIDYSGDETNYTFALTTLVGEAHAPVDDHPVHRAHRLDLGGLPASRAREDGARRICCWSLSCAIRSSNRSSSANRKPPTTSPGQSPPQHCSRSGGS